MNHKILWSLIIGTLISAIALYFAFRNVPFSELLAYIKTINFLYVIPSLLIFALTYYLRVIRWQTIVSEIKPISFKRAYHPVMIAFGANCILPGRVGEFARPVLLKTKEKISLMSGIATVAAERIFDIITLLVLLSIVFYMIEIDPSAHIEFAGYHLDRSIIEAAAQKMVILSIIIITGVLLLSIEYSKEKIKALINKIPSLLFFYSKNMKEKSQRITTGLILFIDNISIGLSMLKSPFKVFLCLFFSFSIWGLTIFFYYIFSLGCPGIQLTMWQLCAFMIIICFAIALPSVPGYWGLWEAGGVFALSLFGVLSKEAAGFTLTSHALQIFPVIIAGLVSAMMTSVNIFQISYKER